MATILLTVAIFVLAGLGLGLGALLGRGPLRGGCGGPAARCLFCPNRRAGR